MKFILAAVLVLVAVLPAVATGQQATGAIQVAADASEKSAFDPQSLVGTWRGEYGSVRGGRYGVSWTITNVNGTRVEGSYNYGGTTSYNNRDVKFVGSLQGNIFSAESVPVPGGPPASWSFTVNEDGTMSGSFFATRSTDFVLKKTK